MKNPDSASHLRSKRHVKAIGDTDSEQITTKTDNTLEQRVSNLEKQIELLISKLNNIESKMLKMDTDNDPNRIVSYSDIKEGVLSMLSTIDTLVLDQVFTSLSYPWEYLERALVELNDDGLIAFVEAPSTRKIYSQFGAITRL